MVTRIMRIQNYDDVVRSYGYCSDDYDDNDYDNEDDDDSYDDGDCDDDDDDDGVILIRWLLRQLSFSKI